MAERKFKLYSNCILVNGVNRLAIYDLKGRVFFIPERFINIAHQLKEVNGINSTELNNYPLLSELCDDLQLKGLGSWHHSEIADLLIPIKFDWDSPYLITNAIIDIYTYSNTFEEKFIIQLAKIGCPFVQIRLLKHQPFDYLYKILNAIEEADILSVQLLIPFSSSANFVTQLDSFVSNNPRIAEAIIYNSKSGIPKLSNKSLGRIIFTEENIINVNSCGRIEPALFIPTVSFFSEAVNSNTCLGRKVSLTSNGLIKNCPSMKSDYGHINDVDLKDVINSSAFQFWWYIKKDDIETCKECEFRYMCSDCRAYTLNPDNPYSKPSKCNYNPSSCSGF